MKMKAILVICSILMVTMAFSQPSNRLEMDRRWEEFKMKYNRQFGSEEEEAMRKRILSENVELVEKHNLEYSKGLRSYKMAINRFSDWTSEEMSSLYGLRRSNRKSQN